ncbi:MAG: cupin-like domain-containing protein [Litorimonas sp.]
MSAPFQSGDLFAQATSIEAREAPRQSVDVAELEARTTPLVLRDFAADWPAVRAARTSTPDAIDYFRRFDVGAVVPIAVGPPAIRGRIFYDDAHTGINVDRGQAYFSTLLDQLSEHGTKDTPPAIYMASVGLDECVPGFAAENPVDFGGRDPLASLWIGTKTRIAAHNDLPLNVACVAAGRRRFTLFPPDQTPNLYVGPFEHTPAGRPISLVDFHDPDLVRFPRFARAAEVAQTVILEPGDALFIPSMWWHHVEALEAFNVLVNYWWRRSPKHLGTPQDALMHAMLALRDLPEDERETWRGLFDHYVFGDADTPRAHVPDAIRGLLSPIDEGLAARVKGYLRGRLK